MLLTPDLRDNSEIQVQPRLHETGTPPQSYINTNTSQMSRDVIIKHDCVVKNGFQF